MGGWGGNPYNYFASPIPLHPYHYNWKELSCVILLGKKYFVNYLG